MDKDEKMDDNKDEPQSEDEDKQEEPLTGTQALAELAVRSSKKSKGFNLADRLPEGKSITSRKKKQNKAK